MLARAEVPESELAAGTRTIIAGSELEDASD